MPNRPSSKAPEPNRSVMRHAGMASTLFFAIGGGAWLGRRWDEKAGHEVAWGTAAGALFGLFAAMVMVIRDAKR